MWNDVQIPWAWRPSSSQSLRGQGTLTKWHLEVARALWGWAHRTFYHQWTLSRFQPSAVVRTPCCPIVVVGTCHMWPFKLKLNKNFKFSFYDSLSTFQVLNSRKWLLAALWDRTNSIFPSSQKILSGSTGTDLRQDPRLPAAFSLAAPPENPRFFSIFFTNLALLLLAPSPLGHMDSETSDRAYIWSHLSKAITLHGKKGLTQQDFCS